MTSTFSTFTRGTESDTFAFASRPPRQPRPRKKASLSNLVDSISRATSAAYDTFIGSQSDDEDNDGLLPVAGVLRRRRSGMFGRLGDIGSEMMSPRREVVEVLVRYWWSRAIVFIVVPAGLVVGWAAIPLPVTVKEGGDAGEVWSIVEMLLRWLWPKEEGLDALIATASSIGTAGVMGGLDAANGTEPIGGGPGHGTATVQIHFWFFLVVYYGFYLLMGLFYMNSLFNLYNMNWYVPISILVLDLEANVGDTIGGRPVSVVQRLTSSPGASPSPLAIQSTTSPGRSLTSISPGSSSRSSQCAYPPSSPSLSCTPRTGTHPSATTSPRPT